MAKREVIKKDKRTVKLEKSLGIFSIVILLGGMFFLSPELTGNAIAGSDTAKTSFIGVGLMIIGLIVATFFFSQKKN